MIQILILEAMKYDVANRRGFLAWMASDTNDSMDHTTRALQLHDMTQICCGMHMLKMRMLKMRMLTNTLVPRKTKRTVILIVVRTMTIEVLGFTVAQW